LRYVAAMLSEDALRCELVLPDQGSLRSRYRHAGAAGGVTGWSTSGVARIAPRPRRDTLVAAEQGAPAEGPRCIAGSIAVSRAGPGQMARVGSAAEARVGGGASTRVRG
jgi:hypothetical protein